MKPTLCVDLGGTTIRAAAVTGDGQVLHRIRRPTPQAERPDALVEMVAEVQRDVTDDFDSVVIGAPGIIDHREGRVTVAPNLPQSWVAYLNTDWLGAQTGLDVSLANDADLATVGEWAFGAGAPYDDVAYVTISTGIGAGMVVGDRLVRGRYSGGELGHTVIDIEAAGQGEAATVEGIGGGRALAAAAEAAGLPGGASLAELVAQADPAAVAVWNRAIDAAAVGIANLCWLVAPELVVVGGGIGRNADLVLPIIRQTLDRYGPDSGQLIELATAELGDDAALVGAPAWVDVIGSAR